MRKFAIILIVLVLTSVSAFAQPDSGNDGRLSPKQIKMICQMLSGDCSPKSNRFFNEPQQWETVPEYQPKTTRDILVQMGKEKTWELVALPKSNEGGYVARYALRNKHKSLLYQVGPDWFWGYPVLGIDSFSSWQDYPSAKLQAILPAK